MLSMQMEFPADLVSLGTRFSRRFGVETATARTILVWRTRKQTNEADEVSHVDGLTIHTCGHDKNGSSYSSTMNEVVGK